MEIKNRQKVLAITAGAALALLIGNSVIYDPLAASWKARGERIAQLRQQVDEGKRMLNSEQSISGRWDDMRTNALPNNVSQAEAQLQKSFDRWERASGVTRVSFKPQWKQEDAYMTLECRVDYSGDMTKIKNFLYQVESDHMGLKVDDVEISSRDDNGQTLALGLQVSGLLLSPAPQGGQP